MAWNDGCGRCTRCALELYQNSGCGLRQRRKVSVQMNKGGVENQCLDVLGSTIFMTRFSVIFDLQLFVVHRQCELCRRRRCLPTPPYATSKVISSLCTLSFQFGFFLHHTTRSLNCLDRESILAMFSTSLSAGPTVGNESKSCKIKSRPGCFGCIWSVLGHDAVGEHHSPVLRDKYLFAGTRHVMARRGQILYMTIVVLLMSAHSFVTTTDVRTPFLPSIRIVSCIPNALCEERPSASHTRRTSTPNMF